MSPASSSCGYAGGNFKSGFSDPQTPLLIFTFSAFFFLFITSFGSPFIGWIYFIKVNISNVEVVTFGVFGFCWQYENSTNVCSQPRIGYEFGLFLDASPIVVPITSSPIINALVLHVLSFTATVIALPAIVIGHFRKTSLFKWTFKFTLFLALIALIAFVIDLVFFYSVRKELAGQATVVIGNGPWFTLTGCILLLLGGCLFKVQSGHTQPPEIQARATSTNFLKQPRDAEKNPISIEDNGDIDLLRQVLLSTLGHQANRSQRLAVQKNSPKAHTGSNDKIQTSDDTRRLSISIDRKVPGFLVEKSVNPVNSNERSHSLQRSASGYAPSSYHTYRSSSLVSGQTITETFAFTRPSSGVPSATSHAQDPSLQSTMELHRAPSWVSAKSRSRSKRARKSMTKADSPTVPERSPVSTLPAVHGIPPVPRWLDPVTESMHAPSDGRFSTSTTRPLQATETLVA